MPRFKKVRYSHIEIGKMGNPQEVDSVSPLFSFCQCVVLKLSLFILELPLHAMPCPTPHSSNRFSFYSFCYQISLSLHYLKLLSKKNIIITLLGRKEETHMEVFQINIKEINSG